MAPPRHKFALRLSQVLALHALAQLEVALLSRDKGFALYSLPSRKLRGNALVVGHCRQLFSFLSSSAFSASRFPPYSCSPLFGEGEASPSRGRGEPSPSFFFLFPRAANGRQFSICACRCRDEVLGFRHR